MSSLSYLADGFVQAWNLLLDGDGQTWSAIRVTVEASSLSVAASLLLGIPAGFALGHGRFPGRRALRLVADTLLSFPTVVIGLITYMLLSRQGPMGGLGLLFTLPGMALGQTLLGLPIVIALTASSVESLDKRLAPTLLTLGAGPARRVLTTIAEARHGLLLAAVAAYGRIVSEVGISMMVGGNIKWHTRTITTAIALETGKGQFALGIALGIVLLLVAFATNLGASLLRRRAME